MQRQTRGWSYRSPNHNFISSEGVHGTNGFATSTNGFRSTSRSETQHGTYVATGFNGWGISNGTAAGMLIADQIGERANPWATLFDPTRRVRQDFNKGGESQSLMALKDIRLGEGGVIKLGKGRVAVRKAMSGSLHALSASCTHEGCTVTWNNVDRTWDCPCHGSIFSADGKVIQKPAKPTAFLISVAAG